MAGAIRAVSCLSRNKRGADIAAVLFGTLPSANPSCEIGFDPFPARHPSIATYWYRSETYLAIQKLPAFHSLTSTLSLSRPEGTSP